MFSGAICEQLLIDNITRTRLILLQGKIFTPRLGEIVDATIESHIYQVTLSDAVMSSLIFQTVNALNLCSYFVFHFDF